jgi:meso-butanediol dehydrogenase / (S,S)-butanediol dehydrogenase / diacetyl reductase
MAAHVNPAGFLLHRKVAMVTGGAGAIGGAVVARLLSEGVRVVAVDQDRPPDPAPAGVSYLRGDVTQPATALRAVATAEAAFGGLDLLVNAASASHQGGLADMDLTWWSRVLAVNLTGTMLACQAAVPAMRHRGGGVIVNLGAVHLESGQGEQLAYAVSRDAVLALSRHLALALEPLGIRVECVRLENAAEEGDSPDKNVAAAVIRVLSSPGGQLPGNSPTPPSGTVSSLW